MKEKHIAWEGDHYIIEWYFNNNDKSPAKEYFEQLDDDAQDQLISLFVDITTKGTIFNKKKFNNEGNKIFAFKPKPHRFLCFFFTGSKIIITNAFIKKQDKLPPRDPVYAYPRLPAWQATTGTEKIKL